MPTTIVRFVRDESGATAIEYGLLVGGLAAAIIVTVNSIGTRVFASFNLVNNFGK